MNGWGKMWGHSSGNGEEAIDAGEILKKIGSRNNNDSTWVAFTMY